MENKENILDELTNFEKRRPNDIPQILEDYLIRIAKTGDTMFPWIKLKPLFMYKMERVMAEFYESCPIDDITHCPNVDRFKYDLMKEKLLEAIDSFSSSAPFTIQRLCELVTAPRKHYKHTDKFMRGLEKNVLVVSTVEPGCSHIYSCDCARKRADHQTAMMNGIADVPLNGVDRHTNETPRDEKVSEEKDQDSDVTASALEIPLNSEGPKDEDNDRLSVVDAQPDDKKQENVDNVINDGICQDNIAEKPETPESAEDKNTNDPPDKLGADDEKIEKTNEPDLTRSPGCDDAAVSSSTHLIATTSEATVSSDKSVLPGKRCQGSRKRSLDEDSAPENSTGDGEADREPGLNTEIDSSCKRGKMPSPQPGNDVTQSSDDEARNSGQATTSVCLLDDDQTSCDSEGFEAAAVVVKGDSSDDLTSVPSSDADSIQQPVVATTTSTKSSDAVVTSVSMATTTVIDSDIVGDDDENNLAAASGDDECVGVGVDDDDDEIATTVTTTETIPVRDEDDNAMDVPASDSLLMTSGNVTTTMINSNELVTASTSGMELDATVNGGVGEEPMDED